MKGPNSLSSRGPPLITMILPPLFLKSIVTPLEGGFKFDGCKVGVGTLCSKNEHNEHNKYNEHEFNDHNINV